MKLLKIFKSDINKHCLISTSFMDFIWEKADKEAIITTQIVDCNLSSKENDHLILELNYKDNKLFKANENYGGDIEKIDLLEEHKELPFTKVKVKNTLNYLLNSSTSKRKLFGSKSLQFKIPFSSENYTVNYYGKINKELVNWLPFSEIEIFAPEFLQGTLFIDYSDAQNPKYLNEEVIQKENYPDKGQGFTIKYFNEARFSVEKLERYGEPILGYLGVPIWVQYPEIPRCPKTNNVMKFMLQIETRSRTYPEPGEYNYEPDVFIFMEPNSKIVGIVLQRS